MADYVKVDLRYRFSANSDYSSPKVDRRISSTSSADEVIFHEVEAIVVGSGGTTVTTSHLSDSTSLLIYNKDSSIAVTVTLKSDGNGGTAWSSTIPALGFFYIPDFTPSANILLVSASGTPELELLLGGT